jgi:hypothetical protein
MLFAVIVACLAGLLTVHGFLAYTAPCKRGVLVVEGWISTRSLADAAQEFRQGNYQYLAVVGGPVAQSDSDPSRTPTYADVAEAELRHLGVDPSKLVKIAGGEARNRTFASALAFRRWLQTSGTDVRSVDVFTAGVHARKSWILFQYALGDTYDVGVIAGAEHSYDPQRWLISRRGLWTVSRNMAGYLYSKLQLVLARHGWSTLSLVLGSDEEQLVGSPDAVQQAEV